MQKIIKQLFPSEKFFYATFYEFAFFEPLELFSSEYYSSHCVDLGQFQNISGSESEYDELKRYQGSIREHFFDHKNTWQGNCQGLAFYCYLNSLIYKKYFKAPYVFAIGSILPSGEVRGVGHCYGKIILSLLFVLSNIVNKVFFDKDFLFILPRFYKMFFDKLFVFIEDKYNIKINRLYLYNIKDINDKENNNLFTEGYKMDFKLNENSYGYKDFSVNSLEDSLESLIPKKNDNFKQEIFDIYSHAIDVFQEVSGVKRKKSTFFSSGWNSLLSIIGLKNENETADFNFRYIWYDLIESIRSTHFLKKEQKIELVCNSFDKESIENLCSFFESGNHKIEFFYGKGE